ncbi:MAG TPA: hypothetical protein VH482_21070 [Thermomicrobiales bacterium]|jgi:hypothetical protein
MLRKRTLHAALLLALVAGTAAVGLARSAHVAGQATPDAQAKIADAMSAAPASVAEHATILDNALDADGKFVVLRQGSNGWSCLPDAYGTPGPDPWCFDQTWLDWTYAFMAKQDPHVTVPGLAYMLQGGSDASNTDPFATAPEAGNEWMASPPHVMLVLPGKIDPTAFTTDHANGGPWVMWAGTPYEHIMMPVAEHAASHTS